MLINEKAFLARRVEHVEINFIELAVLIPERLAYLFQTTD